MFIAHGEKFRKHARWIMAGVLILLIPGFIALFTQTGRSDRQQGDLPTLRGKPINAADYQVARNAVMAQYVINSGREVPRTAEFEDRLKQEAVLRLLFLRKASELGVRVVDSELIQQVRSQPLFHMESGQFDPERYRRFLIFLNNYGINEALFEQVMREQLLEAKLQALVTTGAKVSPTEVQLTYTPVHEKQTIELVQFDVADYRGTVTVSNEEARAYYDENKESFRTPAQMKVRYAEFLTDDAKKTIKLTDEEIADYYERNQAMYAGTNNPAPPLEKVKPEIEKDLLVMRADRTAADRATEFAVKLVREPGSAKPDFAKVCADFGVKPKETGYFLKGDLPVGAEAGPAFAQAAFALSADSPYSDPVAGTNGYLVLEYVDYKASAIPDFEKIKDEVTAQVKRLRIYDATVTQGRAAVDQIKKLIASGQTFAAACAELKLKVTTPPPLTLSDEKLDLPSAGRIQQLVLGMKVDALSDFIPTSTGGLVFHLKDRQPPDPAEFEKDKAKLLQQALQRNRQALFNDWVNALVREEQVDFGRMRSRPAQPEPVEQPEPDPEPAKS
jgi:peptidyl-prolyl cis-trans isomerase D